MRPPHSTYEPASPIRPGELADEYFAGEVAANERRVTPYGIFWAIGLLVAQGVWLRLVLGYPGLGTSAAVNDGVIESWLPLFLLSCAAAPLVALALAADRDFPDPYGEGVSFGHPIGVALCSGIGVALSGIAFVAYAATRGPHASATIAVGTATLLAVAVGTAAGLLTVHRPVLRTSACWAVLAVWVGLTVRRAFVWAVAPHDAANSLHGGFDVTGSAPAMLAIGVALTALIGGIAGYVRTRGLAPLLGVVAALWICAAATSSVGLGMAAFLVAPWRIIAWSLGGAVAGVLALAVRAWWRGAR